MIEYFYPNEAATPLLWEPVLFAYTLLVSGADLLILASLGYLTKKLEKTIPLLLILGISFFSVVLLGPLADLRSPHKAPLLFSIPHISPTYTTPGISLIAFQSILWIIALILSIVFMLLYFSYPMYLKSKEVERFKGLYLAFSLGVDSREKYDKLSLITKGIAIILLLPATLWGLYPSTLLISQTWSFVWRNWVMLPVIYFADTFVVATAIAILVYFIWRRRRMEAEVIQPLLKVHAAGSLSVSALTALQLSIWWFWFDDSIIIQSLTTITSWMFIVIALLITSFVLSLIALRFLVISILVSLVAFAGTIANKWNILMNSQLISKTGMGVFELHLPADWLFKTASPIALAIFLLVIISSLFPLEVKEVG